MRRKIVFLAVALFVSASASFGASCGACSGCALIWPRIESAKEEIEKAYDKMEKEVAEYYEKKITPLEDMIKELEKETARMLLFTQLSERKILQYKRRILFELQKIKALESTRSYTMQTQPKSTAKESHP